MPVGRTPLGIDEFRPIVCIVDVIVVPNEQPKVGPSACVGSPRRSNSIGVLEVGAGARDRPVGTGHVLAEISSSPAVSVGLVRMVAALLGIEGQAMVIRLHIVNLSMEHPASTGVGLNVNPSANHVCFGIIPGGLHVVRVIIWGVAFNVQFDHNTVGQSWALYNQIRPSQRRIPSEFAIGQTYCHKCLVWIVCCILRTEVRVLHELGCTEGVLDTSRTQGPVGRCRHWPRGNGTTIRSGACRLPCGCKCLGERCRLT
mmetsp:Transcript_37820/g.61292  ORF Transcript_37820/g.61292 Transcript_37820/m.61292 type:complete len:257 (+) Transcript_37820:1862-2632(+)